MKNVRIYFKKIGRLKFVSHLDMTRVMSRLIKKSGIPVWYTEGFNRHIYMNFALPLSLGFEGHYEVMDIRLNDDNYPDSEVLSRLQAVSPEGLEFFGISEPIKQTKDIGFAEYLLNLHEFDDDTLNSLEEFLSKDSVLCLKKGKKGKVKEVDIIPKIKSWELKDKILKLCLVAGSEDNLNPTLIMDTFFGDTKALFYSVTRSAVFDKNGEKYV